MKQVVSVQIGQCGNELGAKFWELISSEHGIQEDGTIIQGADAKLDMSHIGAYYEEAENGKYAPRAVLADLDPKSLNNIRSRPIGQIFKGENMISGQQATDNNYAKGYYTLGAEMAERVLEAIRKEAEACDSLDGFQLTHSIGGGSGSGLGSLLLQKLREEYTENSKSLETFTVIPSAVVSDTVVECYNATLALRHLAESANGTYCIDNESLFNLCRKPVNSPTYGDLNIIAAQTMSGITSSFRFSSGDYHLFRSSSLSPSSKALHFYILGVAPHFAKDFTPSPILSPADLCEHLFDPKNLLAEADPSNGKTFKASILFRGGAIEKEDADEAIHNLLDKNSEDHIPWLPKDAIKSTTCPVAQKAAPTSATFVANSTSIADVFQRLSGQFTAMYRRKAFIHWYTEQGMDESEFSLSHDKLKDLISEYRAQQEPKAE